ncbi:MAG: protein kinase domain-containing protein [Gemmatimonadales bacterium]
MDPEFDRLQQALAPRIALEHRLGSGGMGTVWLAREIGVDRLVAVKTLRPDRYTADSAQRFAEEARNAARLFHPNVVRIHYNCPDGAAEPYFVMQYMEGETLRARLDRGALPYEAVVRLGHDLLAALTAAHRAGIIHRDVKPANVFLQDGRAVLGDFGISKAIDRTLDREATGGPLGTPDYMAPEQYAGEASGGSDLWAVGAVLWEACTGRRWARLDPAAVDWAPVAPPLRGPLARALEPDQSRRWSDAAAFAGALPARPQDPEDALLPAAALPRPGRSMPRKARIRPWLLGLGVAAIGLWLWWIRPTPQPVIAPVGLVVAPFDQAAGMPPTRGYELAGRTSFYLRRLPGVTSVPIDAAARAWRSADSALAETERLGWLTSTTHARYGVSGAVQVVGAELEVRLRAYDTLTRRPSELSVRGDSADLARLGDRIGLEIAQRLLGGSVQRSTARRFTENADAAANFWQGEEAASRGAWKTAETHYLRALRADSALVLAKWRLGMARRWSLSPETFSPLFYPLDSVSRDGLSPTEARLVDAQYARSSEQRFKLYQQALDSAPWDPHVALLYGDELLHRGPLAGYSLDSAVAMLTRAVTDDPFLAPAWEHLAWARIRLGQRDSAATALQRLAAVTAPPEESWVYVPALLRVAFAARFDAPPVEAVAYALDTAHSLSLAARGAIGFDLPRYQLAFGVRLARASRSLASDRANGLVAEGVALMALGRPAAAFARFDSAVTLFPSPEEATLQAAEWRVIPAALGLPGVSDRVREDGRARLASLATGGGRLAYRAAWALAVDGFLRRDTVAMRRWRVPRGPPDVGAEPLARLLEALEARARGEAEAIGLTDPVLEADSAGRQIDPFLRATAHLVRGEWLEEAGRLDLADRSWLWYENSDVVGTHDTEAQPADVDWALGAYAGARRATLALKRRDHARACALARRTLGFWAEPEPGMAAAVASLRALARKCPP